MSSARVVKRAVDIGRNASRLKQVSSPIRSQLTNITESELETLPSTVTQTAMGETDAVELNLHRLHTIQHGTSNSSKPLQPNNFIKRFSLSPTTKSLAENSIKKSAEQMNLTLNSDSDTDSDKVLEDCLREIQENTDTIDVSKLTALRLSVNSISSSVNTSCAKVSMNDDVVAFTYENNTIALVFQRSKTPKQILKDIDGSVLALELSFDNYLSCITSTGHLYVWKCVKDASNSYTVQKVLHLTHGPEVNFCHICFSKNAESPSKLCCSLEKSVFLLDMNEVYQLKSEKDEFITTNYMDERVHSSPIVLHMKDNENVQCVQWTKDGYLCVMTDHGIV